MNTAIVKRAKSILLGLGIFMIVSSVLMVMLMTSGLMHLPETLFAGESPVHTVARLAVVGCLLAAVGSHE